MKFRVAAGTALALSLCVVIALVTRKAVHSAAVPLDLEVTHHVDLEALPDPPPVVYDAPPPPSRKKPALVELRFRSNKKIFRGHFRITDGAGLSVINDAAPADGSPVSLVLSPDKYDVRVGGEIVATFDLRYRKEEDLKLTVAVGKRR